MEYPNGIYLYGKLNKEITIKEYEGSTTDTSTTSVIDSTIKVDVIKVPNKLTIKEAEDLFQTFDGSKEVVVDLTPYAKEVQLLDSVELVSTSSDQNKLIFKDKSGNEITSVDISGFTQIQADWNQEDTTSEAYIKNKPEIYRGMGISSLKQKEDPKYNGVIKAVDKNPYAKVLETTLTNEEIIGASGDYAVSLGGNSSAQGKRSLGAGTSSVAKGAYSHSLGDNTVTTIKGTDSTAIGYQTTTDAPASFADGSYTVVLGQKYIEGMFDPSAEPGQPGTPTEPGTTPTDSLEMDKRRGEAGHASGFNSYVSGFAGYADGVSNVADGHISKSSGRSNRSWSYLSKTDGYQSVVKPDDTDPNATGEGSWANGKDIQIIGAKYAYSGGEGNVVIAGADNSFSYGKGLQSKGQSQTVIGQYNENHSEDVFEVGSGQDIVNRKTTFRVTKDGKAYYNEFEVSNVKTTGDKIAELDNKLTPKINSNTTEISNLWTTIRDTNTNLNLLNAAKLDKIGGTVEGTLNVKQNLNVTGNLNVSGTATAVKTQSLLVIDNVIATNSDKQELTTLLSGLALNKNANETYGLMYDPADNTVKFGQGTLSDTGVFTFNAGEGKPLAIRAQSTELNKDHLIKWDSTTNSFVDSGKSIGDLLVLKEPTGVQTEFVTITKDFGGNVQQISLRGVFTPQTQYETFLPVLRGLQGQIRGQTAPLAQQNDLDLINRGELTEKLNDKLSTSNIGRGLSVSDNKVNANIAKIRAIDSTEFTPDENGVVTIPDAGRTTSGLVKIDSNFGIAPVTFSSTPKGTIAVAGASDVDIGKRTNVYKPITSYRLNLAVKAALTDDKRIGTETTAPTTFTDTEKDRACEILGATRYAMKVTIL